MKVTEHVRGTSSFVHFRAGALLYRTNDTGFEFPVPAEDTNGATFEAEHKSLTLMRWIRKQIDVINTEAEKKLTPFEIILGNMDEHLVEQARCSSAHNSSWVNNTIALLTKRLFENHPDFFEQDYFIPTGDVKVKDVKTSKYHARWTFESNAFTEEELITDLADKLAEEIRTEIAAIGPDKVIAWHLPVASFGIMVDPQTFEPVVSFMARYSIEDRRVTTV